MTLKYYIIYRDKVNLEFLCRFVIKQFTCTEAAVRISIISDKNWDEIVKEKHTYPVGILMTSLQISLVVFNFFFQDDTHFLFINK